MLSIVDLKDFLEINRSLYQFTASSAAAQAQAVEALVRLLASRQGLPAESLLGRTALPHASASVGSPGAAPRVASTAH
jgi:hypothetical protein